MVPGDASASVLTELPSLTRDVDFGPADSPMTIAMRTNDPPVVPYDSLILMLMHRPRFPSWTPARRRL